LGNLAALDDIRRVAWHPSGKFALLLATKGQVLRYDAGAKALAALTTLGKDAVDVAADPAGGFFLVIGKDSAGAARLWRGAVGADGAVAFAADVALPYGDPVAVAAEPGGARFVLATRAANPTIAYLTLWQDGQGLGKLKAFNTSGGIVDAMWAGTGLPGLSGSQAIVTSQGLNGAGSQTWVLDSNAVLANGWSPGFGNGGGAAWRPQGSYGMVTGTSSNVVYVFDGTWSSTYLPGVNNGASPQALGWKGDGTRALVVGRATGSPMAATVIEHRPGWSQAYSKSDWLNQSIPGFDKAPWAASFNTFLLDIAWRPATLCDEGLIVGSDTGSAGQTTYGLAIRFYDSDDPACAPLPK
jgi:DNA-binding beta-propeller fold protein YncE